MKSKKVIISIGIPGSGKTTWALEFLRKNPDWVKVSRDDFRFMLRNSPVLDFKGESLVTDLFYKAARRAILNGYNVILDNTHCKLSYINQAIEMLNDVADIDYRYFDVPLKTCIERDEAREKKVGQEVIKRMHKDLTNMLDVFDFQPRKRKERRRRDYAKDWNPDLPNAIITDIDGTVAHMNGKRGPFDWKRVGLDDPDTPIIEALKAWKATGAQVIAVSGRDGSCQQETEEWLKAAEVPFDAIFMRPAGDFRKDSLIKKEIYENYIKDRWNVIMVYDDRDQVVEIWRSLGLKCAQVEPGEF